jgi:hypothetical protein
VDAQIWHVAGIGQGDKTFGAWDRDEYASVSNVVLEVTGHAPGTYEEWCRKNRDFFESRSDRLAS